MENNQIDQYLYQLKNGTNQQKKEASEKISNCKEPSAVPLLINSIDHNSESEYQQAIVDGLQSIGSQEALDYLAGLEKSGMELNLRKTVKPASSNRRALNLFIDTIIYEVVMIFVIMPAYIWYLGVTQAENNGPSYFLSFLMLFLYYFLFELFFQKTPAKFITRTKVVMEDGSKPDAGVMIKRTLARFVPGDPISIYTGKDNDKKGTWWHDRWNATRVIQELKK